MRITRAVFDKIDRLDGKDGIATAAAFQAYLRANSAQTIRRELGVNLENYRGATKNQKAARAGSQLARSLDKNGGGVSRAEATGAGNVSKIQKPRERWTVQVSYSIDAPQQEQPAKRDIIAALVRKK